MSEQATVVLVHGAWHGQWCWEKVQPLLDEAAVASTAVELPLTSLHDDVAEAARAIERVDGPVVLCGHSYGGAVITEAGNLANVRHLVYLAAFACDEGESPANTAPHSGAASRDLSGVLVIDEDGATCHINPERARAVFFHDCAVEDGDAALARLRSMQLACLSTPVGPPAWRNIPATYAVCLEDQTVHPELQRIMAKRCVESVEWPTAHSPFMNRPDLVAALLIDRARG